jgi:hypothetical protein
VRNHSFESVVGPSGTSGPWSVLETATTQVPQWTRTSSSFGVPLVLDSGTFGWSGFDLARMATLFSVGSSVASQVPGLAGTLSTATNVGQTYALSVGIGIARLPPISADVGSYGGSGLLPYQPASFELRLRESGTGAESAPVLQTSIDQETSWVVLTGSVTANAAYDSVVLRFFSPDSGLNARAGLMDDVRLCRAPSAVSTPNLPSASALSAAADASTPPSAGQDWPIIGILIGLLAVTLIGGLGIALRTNFIGAASGGVWRSQTVSIAIEPASASRAVHDDHADDDDDDKTSGGETLRRTGGFSSVGDPHETTGDGIEGIKISDDDSPRPRDR